MKNFKSLPLFALATSCMMLVSCGSSDGESDGPTPNPEDALKIPIDINIGSWSRATDTSYENGDNVGVYVVNYSDNTAGTLASSGNHVDNHQFTYNSGKWSSSSTIYYKDRSTNTDFYCYYPYGTPSDVNAYSFSVQTNQSTEAGYKASEFLWGKASGVPPTTNPVAITTNHVFSNALVYVKAGEGFTDESLAASSVSVTIKNVKTVASINLATGVATATGSATEVTTLNAGSYYRAMIVPQTIADGTKLISVNVDGTTYELAKGVTFKANTQHKFTVTVNKTGSGIDIGIGGWETDDTDNGGSAE